MRSIHDLDIHEEVLLLGLHETRGVPVGNMDQSFAIGGAMLVYLAFLNRIESKKARGGERLVVTDSRLTGDKTVDTWLERIRASKSRTLKIWLTLMAQDRTMRRELTDRLWLAGILRKEERDVLLFFTRNTFPTQNLDARRRVRDRVRGALLENGPTDARSAALALLVYNGGFVSQVLDRREQKAARSRLKALSNGEFISDRPDVVRFAGMIKSSG